MKIYIHTLCVILVAALCLTSCLKDDAIEITYSDDMAITSFSLAAVNKYVNTKTSAGADTTYMNTLTSGLPVFTIDQYKQEIYNTKPLSAGCDLKHILANITSKNNGTILLQSMVSDSLFYYSSTDSIDFSQTRNICVYANDGSGYRTYRVTVNKLESDSEDKQWNEYAADSPEIPATLYQDVILQKGDGDEGTFQLSKDGGNTWTNELLGDGEDASLLPTDRIAWVSFPYAANENTDYELMAGIIDSDAAAYTIWRKIVDKGQGAAPARWVNIPTEDSHEFFLPTTDILSLVWFNKALYAIAYTGTTYKSRDGGITWKETNDISWPDNLESIHIKATTDTEGNLWIIDTNSGTVWKMAKSK